MTDVAHLGWADGLAFCEALPERAGVVAIPAQAFHDSDAGRHLVRWAFCKEPDVIEDGLRAARGRPREVGQATGGASRRGPAGPCAAVPGRRRR